MFVVVVAGTSPVVAFGAITGTGACEAVTAGRAGMMWTGKAGTKGSTITSSKGSHSGCRHFAGIHGRSIIWIARIATATSEARIVVETTHSNRVSNRFMVFQVQDLFSVD